MKYNGGLPSVMRHNFSEVPSVNKPRSRMNRSFGHLTTFDAGYLVPVFIDEVLPGDTKTIRPEFLARLSTQALSNPIMDNTFLDFHWFFVPGRLVWENFERFFGHQDNPDDSTDYIIPQIISPEGGFSTSSIFDYFGLPTSLASDSNISVSSLFARAYNLIWNEHFRDENIQDSVPVAKDDGPDDLADFNLLRRGKRHDYFTSCLPWPQKGDEINIPIGTSAPVVSDGTVTTFTPSAGSPNNISGGLSYTANIGFATFSPPPNGGEHISFANTGLMADLTESTGITVNDLRQHVQFQRLAEKRARGGSRYPEIILSDYGVVVPDHRLQRPEFLGHFSCPLNINPVANTSGTSEKPQGSLAAYGVKYDNGHRNSISHSFVEHGILMCLASYRSDLRYQQGCPRMFSRRTVFDFYNPTFAHLGEQAVLNKEIYAMGQPVDPELGEVSPDDDVFGYQEHWAEYRYKQSIITGKFRSTDAQPLDAWHLSQKFANLPTLSPAFIEDNPPIGRVLAVQDEPHIIFDSFWHYYDTKVMPLYSVPGYMDHF